jgi:hypothetical protein
MAGAGVEVADGSTAVEAEVAGSIAGVRAEEVPGSIADGQPLTEHNWVPQEMDRPLAILPAALAERAVSGLLPPSSKPETTPGVGWSVLRLGWNGSK